MAGSMMVDRGVHGSFAASAYLVWLLAIRRVPRHPWLGALSILAIAAGVAVLCAVLLLYASLDASMQASSRALRGPAVLEIVDPSGVGPPAVLLAEVRGVEGVRAAAPILELSALAAREDRATGVTVVGVDASIAGVAGSTGKWAPVLAAQGYQAAYASREVLRALAATPNAVVRLSAGERSARLRMLTLPDDSDEDGDGDARLVVVPLEIAQWLAQKPGLATSILVAPEAADAGRELDVTLAVRLQRDLGARYLVLPAAVRADELRRAVAPLSSFATFCALLALVVGAYLVFNTTSMSLRRDLPQIGLLLAIGDDSHRIAMRAVAFAWTLGILGSALGLISGVWIGERLVAAVPAVLQGVHTGGVHLALHPWPFALSLACGILSATAGALLPSLAMLQVRPAEAIRAGHGVLLPRPRGSSSYAVLAGALVVAAALGAGAAFGGLHAGALGAILAAVLLLAPGLLRKLMGTLADLLGRSTARRTSGVLQVVAAGLGEDPSRSVATAIAAMLATATVVAIGGATRDVTDSVGTFAGGLASIDVYVSTVDDPYLAIGLESDKVQAVARADGVAGVLESTATFVWVDGQRLWLRGDDPAAIAKWGFAIHEADRQDVAAGLASGGILVSTQIARRQQLLRGQSLVVPSPSGPVAFPIVATFESWSWPAGTLVLDGAVFKRHFGNMPPSQLAVEAVPGASAESVAERLRRLGGVDAVAGATLRERVTADVRDQMIPFEMLRAVAVLMTAIMVLNTCLIATLQRHREIGILRSIGMSRSQLMLSLLLEVGMVLGLAVAGGAVLGVALQVLGVGFVADATGLPLKPTIHVRPVLEGMGATLVAAILGGFYPTWRAGTAGIAVAIAYE